MSYLLIDCLPCNKFNKFSGSSSLTSIQTVRRAGTIFLSLDKIGKSKFVFVSSDDLFDESPNQKEILNLDLVAL